jgi:hypothetical protein
MTNSLMLLSIITLIKMFLSVAMLHTKILSIINSQHNDSQKQHNNPDYDGQNCDNQHVLKMSYNYWLNVIMLSVVAFF